MHDAAEEYQTHRAVFKNKFSHTIDIPKQHVSVSCRQSGSTVSRRIVTSDRASLKSKNPICVALTQILTVME